MFPANYNTFVRDAVLLTTDIMGENALRYELAYLRRIATPHNLTVEKWIIRTQSINTLLPHLSLGTNEKSADQLTKEVIIPKLPHYLRDDL